LHYPELRPELKTQGSALEFPDPEIRSLLLEEICDSGEPSRALEVAVMSRLDEEQRKRLSAMMVGPLMNEAVKAPALMNDFLNALTENQRRHEVAELRRAASTADGDDAAAAAQAIIARRRRAIAPSS
jgi:hypothetical protein